jgi:hypothetical protein
LLNLEKPTSHNIAPVFHLDRSDREVTDGLRGDHNRLGFALMLGSARFICVFPGADVEIPSSITAFLVDQLGLEKAPGCSALDQRTGVVVAAPAQCIKPSGQAKPGRSWLACRQQGAAAGRQRP